MPKISRFKRRLSDRSGFKFYEIELVKDGAFKVAGDEFDNPPPSTKSLGGEGDVAQGEQRSTSDFSSPATYAVGSGYDHPVFYITATGGITPDFNHAWMYVVGSNANITISANPQIVAGKEGNVLTLEGVGSTITISNGSGVSLMGSSRVVLGSGDTISLYYTTAGVASWWETSRNRLQGGFF